MSTLGKPKTERKTSVFFRLQRKKRDVMSLGNEGLKGNTTEEKC